MLDKNSHQHCESLHTLVEPLAPKRLTTVERPTKRSTVLLLDYGGHKQKDLAVSICRAENVLEFDAAIYPTERDQMIFTKQYIVIDAARAWDQYCARHTECNHTWAAMKDLLYSRVAPTKHHINAALQKHCSAKQGPTKTIMSFGVYIASTCKGIDITHYNKRMFFRTQWHLEIHAALCKGEDYLTFDSCLEAGVEAETVLRLDAEYNKAFKSAPKGQTADKARKDKGKGKASDDSGEGRGRGHGGHGQGGQQHQQGDRSSVSGAEALR